MGAFFSFCIVFFSLDFFSFFGFGLAAFSLFLPAEGARPVTAGAFDLDDLKKKLNMFAWLAELFYLFSDAAVLSGTSEVR
jgi:hypothetical protein